MGVHEIGDYTIKMDFQREKYGLARWDFEIFKGKEKIGFGCDVNTVSFDEKDAIIEILLEDHDIDDIELEENVEVSEV